MVSSTGSGSWPAALRGQGTRVGVGELLTAVRCVEAVDPASREDVAAGPAHRPVLAEGRPGALRRRVPGRVRRRPASTGQARRPARRAGIDRAGRAAPGRHGRSRRRQPGAGRRARCPPPGATSSCSSPRTSPGTRPAESALARELIARLARRHPTRLSRRTRSSRRRSHTPDLRNTVQASLRTAGEPLHRRWRAPTRRPRQLVLVCDVSGSMAPYARMLLQYMHACVVARRRVEAFAFGTRLTRITNELAGRDHDRALDRAAAVVTDFSGGTRIGAALAELNRVLRPPPRVAARSW